MRLNNPISIMPLGQMESIVIDELPLVIIDDPIKKTLKVKLESFQNTFTLWRDHEYDKKSHYSQQDIYNVLQHIINPSLLTFLYSNNLPLKNNFKKTYKNPYSIKYLSTQITDTIIIIPYFSICGYKQAQNNIITVINKLTEANLPVCVIEAVFSKSNRLILPNKNNIQHIQLDASLQQSSMFLKENLYNIATKYIDTKYTKFIFLDSDIIFDNISWYDDTSNMLNYYDIIQPFNQAHWINEDNNNYVASKDCAAKFLTQSDDEIYGNKYHPGFCWAMTRNFFNKIEGFYEECILGAGDLAFVCSLDTKNIIYDNLKKQHLINKHKLFYDGSTYISYKNNIKNLSFRISYLNNCDAYHLYHGNIEDRQYNHRYDLLNNFESIQFNKNKNGILEFVDESIAKICYQYFISRKEDINLNTNHNNIIQHNHNLYEIVSDWQKPNSTELHYFNNHQNSIKNNQTIYIGYAWANLIDKKLTLDKNIIKAIAKINGKKTTICQHIRWKKLLNLWYEMGIDNVYVSHCEKNLDIYYPNIKPWPLFAASLSYGKQLETNKIILEKKYLASFIGCHRKDYRSKIRLNLNNYFHKYQHPQVYFELYDDWFYQSNIYEGASISEQQKENINKYNNIISESIFSLCPEGTGPNTIRLWESMALGSIPVIYSDDWLPPQLPGMNWKDFSIFIPNQEYEQTLDILTSIDSDKINKMQTNCINAFNQFNNMTCG